MCFCFYYAYIYYFWVIYFSSNFKNDFWYLWFFNTMKFSEHYWANNTLIFRKQLQQGFNIEGRKMRFLINSNDPWIFIKKICIIFFFTRAINKYIFSRDFPENNYFFHIFMTVAGASKYKKLWLKLLLVYQH